MFVAFLLRFNVVTCKCYGVGDVLALELLIINFFSMKFKFYISISALFLVCGMNFIYAFEPVEDDHDDNDPGGGSNIVCEAQADCDLFAGAGYVKCYGYDSDQECTSYPALGKVKCDGKEHHCKIL